MPRTKKTTIDAAGKVVESTTDGIRDMFKAAAATFSKTPSAKNYNVMMGSARDFQSAYVADFMQQVVTPVDGMVQTTIE